MSKSSEVRQNNEQILNDIKSLQRMEQQLFNKLESTPNLSTKEQKPIIDKMNQLSNMRINLYKTLSGINQYHGSALESSIDTLKEQRVAVGIVEKELNRAKSRLQLLEEEKNNQIRLVEINNYYGEKYEEHTQLMKIVIFTLIPVILFAYLNNANILPNVIYYILLTIVGFIGAYYFWLRFNSIVMRDNMNYQTYDWQFNPTEAPKGNSSVSVDPWDRGVNMGTCIGSSCCSSDMVYDDTIDKCVKPSKPVTKKTVTKKEGFDVQDILTKQAPYSNGRADYNLTQPDPFNKYT